MLNHWLKSRLALRSASIRRSARRYIPDISDAQTHLETRALLSASTLDVTKDIWNISNDVTLAVKKVQIQGSQSTVTVSLTNNTPDDYTNGNGDKLFVVFAGKLPAGVQPGGNSGGLTSAGNACFQISDL